MNLTNREAHNHVTFSVFHTLLIIILYLSHDKHLFVLLEM